MQQILIKGTTSHLAEVMMRDENTGQGLDGLAYGDVTAWYVREGAATGAQITMADLTLGTFTSGGWKEIDATNLPGLYQFGIPNACLATGANAVTILISATGALTKQVRVLLIAANMQDAVRLGLSALPAAAPAANGGLPTVDANNRIAGIQGTKNTLDNLNDLTSAQVNTQCDLALTDYDPPTRAELTTDTNSVLAQFTGIDTTVEDAVEASMADVVDAIANAFLGTVGADDWTYTLLDDDSDPIPDAEILVTSDSDGTLVVAVARTDAAGQVTFQLTAGTYYVWRSKVGFTFTNPDQEVVT